jgi:RHS repeat-associated protein
MKNAGVLRSNKRSNIFRSGILIFLGAVLAFAVAQPSELMALSLLGTTPNTTAKPLDAPKVSGTYVADGSEASATPKTDTKTTASELTGMRTPTTSTYLNKDGTKTLRYSSEQQNYKASDGSWQKIDNTVKEVPKAAAVGASTLSTGIKNISTLGATAEFNGNAGAIKASMKNLTEGVVITVGGKTFSIIPQGVKNSTPERIDQSTVIYRNAWKNVDLQYELKGEAVKETVILRSADVPTVFNFTVKGGKVIKHPTRSGEYTVEGVSSDFSFSKLTLDVVGRGVISEERVTQAMTTTGLQMKVDAKWLKEQPASSFPMAIDPNFAREANEWWMYKSDGYSCGPNVCYANIGTLYDRGWKSWRTYLKFPYGDMAGKYIQSAVMHGVFKGGKGGITDGRWITMGHANCLGYNCTGGWAGNALAGTDFDINFTDSMRDTVNKGDMGAVWSFFGEEGGYMSYKPYYTMYAYVTYDTPTPVAQPAAPEDKQVVVTAEGNTLKVNPVSDPDGDAVQYYFRVATSQDAESGAVINSDWISSTQWTIPDGILQDGTTYYWHVYTKGALTTSPNWVRSFKVDLRTGKDSTQAFDTLGPFGIALATGNMTTDASTHSMSALGGDIGLKLTYNTPAKANKGLIGEYWNVGENYAFANGAPARTADLVRNDQEINYDWGLSSPGPNVNSDWFYVRWNGYFVAPSAGTYTFGGSVDDNILVFANNQKVFERGCCIGSPDYANSTGVTLKAGEVIPLRVEYMDATYGALAKLYVKKDGVNEQIVPRDWLRTDVRPSDAQYGLRGRYYRLNNEHTFPTNGNDPDRLLMSRLDTKLSFVWNDGAAPTPGLPSDFMTRWTGYVTAPQDGDYSFGANSDDGIRIKLGTGIGGSDQTVLDSWTYSADNRWGSSVNLKKGQSVKITVEFFDSGGPGKMILLVNGGGVNGEVPVKWLTPQANVLPNSWQLSVDVDGNVNYERLRTTSSSAILEDSTGSTHEYTWTGSGYKPGVNEDGTLSRNSDNTFTFIDTDGRIYIFSADGVLTSLTSPTDDRSPASLRYEYSGSPSKLVKITDATSDKRFGTVFYKSVNDNGNCSTPSGYDDAPDGMLCAFSTSDGDITKFYYKNGQLSRIEQPGGALLDYGYDDKGRIISSRDVVSNDAIAAKVRADTSELLTEISYDTLGRASAVKAPAPTAGAARVNHTLEYGIAATNMHVGGATEPNGFSKRIQYDTLLRTVAETDLTGKTQQTEWDSIEDLKLSNTDATGLKSTTIYDKDDRPTDSYGPAPAAWFGADRKPLSQYVSQVPRTSTAYDEGINGPAVSYMAIPERISSVLSNGETMTKGQSRWSTDGRFNFTYQTDGNVVLYTPSGASWNSGTTNKASDRLIMQSDGNLVLYNGSSAVWNTETYGKGNTSRLVVQNDGNVVIWTDFGATWATGTGNWTAGAGNTSLRGSPLLNTTGIGINSAQLSATWTSSPVPSGSNYWGARMTGKLYLPSTGGWKFRIVSDNGVRLSIDDTVITDDWMDGTVRSHLPFTYNNTTDGATPHRFSIDYYHLGGSNATFALYITPPGGTETADVAQYIKPGYNLTTSTTSYDSQLGNNTTTTQYSNPAYGQVSSTTLDPSGLNYVTKATYETPGSGFLRQTTKVLSGGATTNYKHYGSDDKVTVGSVTYSEKGGYAIDPCINSPTYGKAIPQGGMSKGKIEPTGRISESIYNLSGKPIASRYNSDPWTCITYDARGRVVTTVIPSRVEAGSTLAGRTITNNYAVNKNPLITSVSDASGTITTQTDLLGRVTSYIDGTGKVTTNTYDTYGKLIKRVSVVGTETFSYDSYDRVTSQKLDSVSLATVTYDEYSRVKSIKYSDGISLQPAQRDSLGRVTKVTYGVGDKTVSDQVKYSVNGLVTSGTENGVSKSYGYDKAGRLTNATIGSDVFSYGFGVPASTCSGLTGNNVDAGKGSNRTSMIRNGKTTTYCYDLADRLLTSSDTRFSSVTYDSHGNTTAMGASAQRTTLGYDVSDRNTKITEKQSGITRYITYARDANDRIVSRTSKEGSTTTNIEKYVYNNDGSSPSAILDQNGSVLYKYITLPGGISLRIKPSSTSSGVKVYSLSNLHGDVMATANADGMLTGIYITGPFGEELSSSPLPQNATSDTSYGYVGGYKKITEVSLASNIMQMGARVYLPELGRFAQIDPIEGGTLNNYVYAMDPVNQNDVSGKCIGFLMIICIAVVAAISVASASKNLQKNPSSPGAWIGMGLAVTGASGASIIAGGASRGASSGVTGGSASRSASSTASAGKAIPQVRINQANGAAAEARARAELVAKYGAMNVVKHPYFPTSMGRRFPDFQVLQNGRPLFNVEVKSGNAQYGGLQAAKDLEIYQMRGIPTKEMRYP